MTGDPGSGDARARPPAAADWLSADFEPGLVSVIIPTYNCAHLVGETLASVLAQTHDKVEAIVADDGSTDNVAEVVAGWQERFRKEKGWELKFLRLERKGGPSEGRNAGARASRGELLNYLDGDDLLSPDKIAAQFAVMRQTGADYVYGPHVRFYKLEGGYRLGTVKNLEPIAGDLVEAMIEGLSWRLMTALLTRRLSNRVGPSDSEMIRSEDADYVVRCTAATEKVAHCPRGLLYYRTQANTMSSNPSPRARESVYRVGLRMEELALRRLPPEKARPLLARHWGFWAVMFYSEESREYGESSARKALEYDPDYRPPDAGALSRLAYRLAGFRLLARKEQLAAAVRGSASRLRQAWIRPKLLAALPVSVQELLRMQRAEAGE
jgi:glycosyltransferase involved in cell wall biosynthesis